MSLTQLANAFSTDKGTVTGQSHGYTVLYDLLFGHRRPESLDICEIGLCIGGPELATGSAERSVADVPSIRMWHEFFPNSRIVGVDISDCSAFQNDWFTFVRADCGKADELQRVSALGRSFDLIVDDGSHASFHQQRTLLSLFPLLKPGGFFIIEDMQWQPETYAFKLPNVPRTDRLLSDFIRQGRFENTGDIPQSEWNAIAGDIQSVVQFDEDWFYRHRQLFNARHNLTPEMPVFENVGGGIFKQFPRLAKRILGRIRSECEGGEGVNRRPRIKLAIIQKRHNHQ